MAKITKIDAKSGETFLGDSGIATQAEHPKDEDSQLAENGRPKRDDERIQTLYSKDEQEIIEQWIEQAPMRPDRDDFRNSNLVAEIALSNIKGELPQWAQFYKDGHALWGRKHKLSLVKERDKFLNPLYLFMINWADSGPGFSWPESYYSTCLPGYDIYVVTASQDSDDVHGYTDEAIGCFVSNNPDMVNLEASTIIKQWWKYQYDGWGQESWAYLFGTGLIDEETAERMRSDIWLHERMEE